MGSKFTRIGYMELTFLNLKWGGSMRENVIEVKFKSEVNKLGGQAFKFLSPGNSGVPDRIVLHDGKCYFVELKAPGKKLRPLQKYRQRQFASLGFKVYVLDSLDAVKEFIHELKC